MVFCYLFEAKSIQQYLFESGKLKDAIAASERLDRLIDSTDNSLLYQVISNANINTDLLDCNKVEQPELVRFLRCKGGAFYAYCQHQAPLYALRSLWTLTIQQLFPSLEFIDALESDIDLPSVMKKGREKLSSDRNLPNIKFPIAASICDNYHRTGRASVPLSKLAIRASMGHEYITDGKNDKTLLDIDTEHHRQGYQVLSMRSSAALQDRFTPEDLAKKIHYPINIETEFELSADTISDPNKEPIKDIALIHIDGNGLGIILIALQEALKESSDSTYRSAFRNFSEALNQATVDAARAATQILYDKAKYHSEGKTFIPMRPIILGGDDITLLCRADLALEYSQHFCKQFKVASEKYLSPLFKQYINKNKTNIKHYLTASGGILYHKSGHPFTQSHQLVESLAKAAKKLTKNVNSDHQQVGPAALALYRLSNAVSDNFDTLMSRTHQFQIKNSNSISLGSGCFFIDNDAGTKSHITTIQNIVTLSNQTNAPISMTRWRKMAAEIANNNLTEAERIFNRGMDLSGDRKKNTSFVEAFKKACPIPEGAFHQWYWQDNQGNLHTVINDLLLIDHFSPNTSAEQVIPMEVKL